MSTLLNVVLRDEPKLLIAVMAATVSSLLTTLCHARREGWSCSATTNWSVCAKKCRGPCPGWLLATEMGSAQQLVCEQERERSSLSRGYFT